MKTIVSMGVICLGLATAGHAQPDSSEVKEFSRYSRIGALSEGGQSIRRVELPFEVLLEASRPDLADIHVFDAGGQLVPSNTYYTRTRETLSSEVGLQFFPFGADAEVETIRYSFELDQQNTSTRISLPTGGAVPAKTNYVVYIPKETRKNSGALSEIELGWAKPDENLIVPIRVEGSSDLQNWQMLAQRAVVSDLEHDGAVLLANKIKFDHFSGSYLRLTWPDSVSQFDLHSIRGTFNRSRAKPEQRRSRTLTCDLVEADSCQFEFPPQTAMLDFQLVTDLEQYFLQGTLFSAGKLADKGNTRWIRRGRFQQYLLTVDAHEIRNSALNLASVGDRHWQLRFDQSYAAVGGSQFEIQWAPVYQAFLAQGSGPFQLAYGNPAAINPNRGAMDVILARAKKSIDEIETVHLGDVRTVQRDEVYWDKKRIEVFILWAVLIFGVAVLFGIAWRLFRSVSAASQHGGSIKPD